MLHAPAKRLGGESRLDRSRLGRQLAPVVVLFVLGTVLQAFLPPSLGTVMIALRLAVIPICLVLFMFTLNEAILFAVITVFSLLYDFLLGIPLDKEMWLVLSSLLASLPYFKAGIVLGASERARPIWRAILFGMFAFNLLTIVLYANALLGGSLAAEALARVRWEGQDTNFRFALGNAIEMPALVAMATVASALALRRYTSSVAVALVINLATAFVSQSRFVILIAVVPILRLWRRFRLAAQVAVVLLVVGVVLTQRDVVVETMNSVVQRFSGHDENSTLNRLQRLSVVEGQFNARCLTFGNGSNSSPRMREAAGMGYGSVEAVALQLVYENGLLGMAVLALYLVYVARNAGVHLQFRLEFLLVLAQALLALPIITFTPLFFFCAGALCARDPRGALVPAIHRRRRSKQKARALPGFAAPAIR